MSDNDILQKLQMISVFCKIRKKITVSSFND